MLKTIKIKKLTSRHRVQRRDKFKNFRLHLHLNCFGYYSLLKFGNPTRTQQVYRQCISLLDKKYKVIKNIYNRELI